VVEQGAVRDAAAPASRIALLHGATPALACRAWKRIPPDAEDDVANMESTVSGETATLSARSLAPGLTCNDLRKSRHFYVDGLGFAVEQESEMDGEVRFFMLKAGNARLGIGQDDFAKGRDRVKGTGMRIWIGTDQDIHAIAARVKAAGYALDQEPEPLPWGPLGFAVTDPDGFKLTIANES
jgi:catechol 2,3-dioxygenase-like lactoylglutathione lyase family enzyme